MKIKKEREGGRGIKRMKEKREEKEKGRERKRKRKRQTEKKTLPCSMYFSAAVCPSAKSMTCI